VRLMRRVAVICNTPRRAGSAPDPGSLPSAPVRLFSENLNLLTGSTKDRLEHSCNELILALKNKEYLL
jgi:hypothetical protein